MSKFPTAVSIVSPNAWTWLASDLRPTVPSDSRRALAFVFGTPTATEGKICRLDSADTVGARHLSSDFFPRNLLE
jgi:hypothetical protein